MGNTEQKIVTLGMIAARCGVHFTTVHRALNGKGRIDPVTAERIRVIAKEMGYNPMHNQAASRLIALRYGHRVLNHAVAFFLPPVFYQHDYYMRIRRGLLEILVNERFDLMITYIREETDPLPNSVLAGNIDGVISIANADLFDSRLAALRSTPNFSNRPLLSLIHLIPGCASVLVDDRGGAAAACTHLLELGHRHILYLFVEPDAYSSQQRTAGYHDAYRKFGIDPTQHLHPITIDWRSPLETFIENSTRQALQTYPQATAILASNDSHAIRIRNVLLELGARVPEDYSLIGFDDTDPIIDKQGRNILTTVRLPLEEVGRRGARMIIRQILDDAPTEETFSLPVELIVRASTSTPRQ